MRRKKRSYPPRKKGRTKENMGSRKAAGDIISLSYKRLVNMAIFHFFSFYQMAPPLPLTLTICDERLLSIQTRQAILDSGPPFICWRLSVDNRFIMRAISN